MEYTYPVTFQKDENNTVVALVPDIPGTMTVGATEDEALERVSGAIVAMLDSLVRDGEPLPSPSPARSRQRVATLPSYTAAKICIHQTMAARHRSPGALCKELGWSESRMRRLLSLKQRSSLEDMESALRALGKRLVVEIQNAA